MGREDTSTLELRLRRSFSDGIRTRSFCLSGGFRLERITLAGLKGMGGLRQLTNSMAIPKSLWESCQILRRFRPSVVIGVGGYSSGPPVLMAVLMGIPAMLQ